MKQYDVVIVGGGINGCGLLRDLALNGVSALLIEKGDYSSQTSQGSSKMLHGGVRYLENFDFALVQEALEEKNLWLKLAPHVCFEREFYVPLYNFSKYRPWMLGIGLFTYCLWIFINITIHYLQGVMYLHSEVVSRLFYGWFGVIGD